MFNLSMRHHMRYSNVRGMNKLGNYRLSTRYQYDKPPNWQFNDISNDKSQSNQSNQSQTPTEILNTIKTLIGEQNDPNESLKKINTLFKNEFGNSEQSISGINRVNKSNKSNKINVNANETSTFNCILYFVGEKIGIGLFTSLCFIALICALCGVMQFGESNNIIMVFVCFVLFISLLMPILA